MDSSLWQALHKAVDHTILMPTLDAFRALGRDVCNKLVEDHSLLRKLMQHHIYQSKVALLVQNDTIEQDGHDSRCLLVTGNSYFDRTYREESPVETTLSLVVESDGRRVLVIDDSTTTSRTVHDALHDGLNVLHVVDTV